MSSFLRVPILRIVVFWGLHGGPPFREIAICPSMDSVCFQALPGQFFSYAACNSFSPVSPCTWTEIAETRLSVDM